MISCDGRLPKHGNPISFLQFVFFCRSCFVLSILPAIHASLSLSRSCCVRVSDAYIYVCLSRLHVSVLHDICHKADWDAWPLLGQLDKRCTCCLTCVCVHREGSCMLDKLGRCVLPQKFCSVSISWWPEARHRFLMLKYNILTSVSREICFWMHEMLWCCTITITYIWQR